ncbi:MAG: phosphodiesterase [Lachnospiraceae bacterium]|jgi:putative phosphoesterase|uniref:phosphodiesterase n=1 Tax=Candidatus Merdisoma sp. JLR.KK006 TaxID=3112626 RepID=UPI002FEF1307|nr:phosphodiesterase [Lachnospiraceae bacterium]
MKIMIASDIHGAAGFCEEMLAAYDREQAEKLLLLGDILYHGPRNDLPEQYAPKEVIEMLNARKEEFLCVRGNCDTDVDQMVLEFPIMAEYCILYEKGRMIFATHGHIFNEQKLPMLKKGDILLHGHTHVPVCKETEDYIYLNPGSVSIPKDGSWHGYLVLEDGVFTWKELDGTVKQEFCI